MGAHMTGVNRDDAFVRLKNGFNDRFVRLGTSDHEVDVSYRTLTSSPNLVFCLLAIGVIAITRQLLAVRFQKVLQCPFVRAFRVVIYK